MAGKTDIVAGIRLDGEKEFKSAITSINKETGSLKSQLGLLTAQYADQQNSLEYLSKKHDLLGQALDTQKKKVNETKAALQNAQSAYTNIGKNVDKLKDELEQAKKKQEELAKTYGEGSSEVKEQQKVIENLSTAIAKGEKNYQTAGNRVHDWETKLNTAEAQVIKANNAVDANAKLLKEAEEATDSCAKSIDRYGNAVERSTKVTTTMGEKLKSAIVTKGVDMAASAVSTLGNKAKEAAKYAVEVGAAFEKSMSNVAALSGATGADLEALENKARELGSSTMFSASEAADAFGYMALAGWDVQQSLDGIDGIMNLAAASGMELASASDMVTDYLSAFGMEASESAHMADMLATAQKSSNTTAEQLGEAYKNCAANLNASGQDIETTTSFLEAMANQGLKGSEAGTALSAVMRDLNKKMEDGSITINDTAIAIADSSGNYRDLTDIMTDVEAATSSMSDTERQTALQSVFTADSIKGLNLILADGMENISGYEESLRNCDGAAEEMANTLTDNLQGDLTEMNSALEGLGIGAYKYVEGPLRGVVQGVTDIISGITDVITPQKTEIETFIDEVEQGNERVRGLLEDAKNAVSGAETDITQLEAYKTVITELATVEELDAYQKYQMKNAVDALSGSIPELAAAFDEETGKINLSADAINNLFSAQEDYVMKQALLKAAQKDMEAYAEAAVNKAKADAALKGAEEALAKATEEANIRTNEAGQVIGDNMPAYYEAGRAVNEAKEAQKEAADQLANSKEELDIVQEALNEYGASAEDSAESANKSAEANDKLATSAEGASESAEELAAAQQKAAEQAEKCAQIQTDAAQSVRDAWEDLKKEAESEIKFSISTEFDGGEELGVDTITDNLDSQIAGYEKYYQNLQKIKELVQDPNNQVISPEFLSYLESQGTDAANTLQSMVDAMDQVGGEEKLREMSDKYTEALNWQDQIANSLAADKAVLDNGLKSMASSDADFGTLRSAITNSLDGVDADMQTKLQSLVDTAQGIGVQIPDGLTEGITSGEISPDEAVEQLQSAITGQMEGLADVARDQGAEVGEEMVSAIADGVEAGDTGAIMSAYNEIISQIGQSAGAALGEGMTTSTEFAEGAKTVVAEGTAAATAEAENFSEAGSAASEAMASGITAGSATIQSAAKDAVSSAAAAAGADTGQFQTIGANMAEGIARGMASRSGEIQRVARQAVAQAIAAAKAEGDIHSPSKKMEKEVGQWLSKGTAKGIKTHSKEVASEAAAMVSRAMYQAKAAATKSGKSVADALSDTTNFIIANNFGVSGKKTKTTGSGKNKKTETTDKSKTELSKDIMSAAESYFNNLAVLQDVSDQQELKYWKKVQKRLTKGSQAWYDAQKKINQAKAAVASNAAEIGTFDIASDVLKSYQDFYEMSEKAAEEYWDTVRKQFKEGTEDRVKADKEYFDAHKQYLQKLEDINADYLDRIDEKQAEYTDAVKDRAKELASAFDMFEEFESKSASGEDLLFNMQTQAAGYLDWADTLKKLADRGILSSNLMSELEEKGPENSAAIHALQDLSDEQLKAYQQAYNTKMDAASKQAEKEYEGLKQKVEEEVKGLKEAQASDISKVNTTLSSTNSLLASIASKIGTTSETGAASAAATFASEATKPSTQTSTTTEAKTPTASAAAKKTKLQELEEIINSGKSRSTKLSKAEKEKHHALWEWIATTYGKAATNDMYKSLAKALGMKVGKSVSNEEKNMLLKMLKLHKKQGYASGTRYIPETMLAAIDEIGPELILRNVGGQTILTKGSGVIPADLTENLMEWGKITPAALLNAALVNGYKQSTAAASYNDVGQSVLNEITELRSDIQSLQLRMDGRDLVMGVADDISNIMAMRSRRRMSR